MIDIDRHDLMRIVLSRLQQKDDCAELTQVDIAPGRRDGSADNWCITSWHGNAGFGKAEAGIADVYRDLEGTFRLKV